MGIHDKLIKIQKALKAPKGQFNSFGNYKYRSCEDILEAVKPLLNDAVLTLTDDLVLIGDRYYIKATAFLRDQDNYIEVHAWARESLDKKEMDASQITGTASSYARKYALNGLFLIDDTKDADTMDNTNGGNNDKPSSTGKVSALKDKLQAGSPTIAAIDRELKKTTYKQLIDSGFTKEQIVQRVLPTTLEEITGGAFKQVANIMLDELVN